MAARKVPTLAEAFPDWAAQQAALAQEEVDEDEIRDELEDLLAEGARRNLRTFVEAAWPIVEPGIPFSSNWHIDVLCQELEAVTRGEVKRLIINVPPGCMKSLLVSVMWPAWEWATNASRRYLCASYGAHLSVRDNLKVRDIVNSPWYQRHFEVKFSGDQNAKELMKTNANGWRFGTSVGGAGTGEHPDIIIIDDPHSAKQAKSKAERATATDWFDQTISGRGISRDVSVVVIMQRLHEEDLTGHLLRKGAGWRHVRIPMEYEPAIENKEQRPNGYLPPYEHDPRTEPGEPLWPHLFTLEKLSRWKTDLGAYGVAGQLQQRPSPQGGGMFKRSWFKFVDAVPTNGVLCRGWDTAATENAGDYTVGLKMLRSGGNFYVVDVLRGQWGPAEQERFQDACIMADGRWCRQREEQEPGSAGKVVIASKARRYAGYDYKGVPTTGDKETRARNFRAQVEAGNVYLLRGSWNEAYLDELENFPNGLNDDQVDASSAAFNELTTGPVGPRVRKVNLG